VEPEFPCGSSPQTELAGGFALEVLDEELGQDQEPSQDGDDPVETDSATTGRPREHQDSIEGHELFGPDHAGQSKDEVRLDDKAED
jgi:hypothetical protein